MTYHDEVSIDTPILDPMVKAVIQEADKPSSRAQRADRFSRYLDDQWKQLDGLETGLDWPAYSGKVREAAAKLESRLEASGSTAPPTKRRR
jgi:hypothetical protein